MGTVKIPEGMAINLFTPGKEWMKWVRACAWIEANPIARAMRQKVRYHFAKRIQQRKAGVLLFPEDTRCPEQPT